jgi:hypothetical protein
MVFVNSSLLVYYAGSLKTSQYSTGTVSLTNGSTDVTGSGTSWTANVDAGMILTESGVHAVVKSVDSNTEITLTDPWQGSTLVGTSYLLDVEVTQSMPFLGGARSYVVAAGAGSPRLLFCTGNRVYFTLRGDPFTFSESDYHEVPASALIVGAEGRGDSALIFATGGIWSIGNLSFDPVDASGNIQHIVEQVNKDVILWDDYGIGGFSGGLVIPAIDDVFAMNADGLTALTAAIRPLYRDYVKAGYQTGQGAVHRGHYFLPILNGTTLVDTLVSRLDRGAAWTRFAGGAAGAAYATLIAETSRTPKLLGLAAQRVTDLSGAFTPAEANALDADGTTSDMVIITRDLPTGANQPGFATRLRARYELDGVTSSTTDDFERANESPLASPYTAWTHGSTRPNLTSGAAVLNGSAADTRRADTIGPGCFSQITFETAVNSDGITSYYVGARLTSGYSAWLDAGTGGWLVRIRRVTGTTFTAIATSATVNYSSVQGLKLECVGTQITAYVKLAGTWTQAVTIVDSTYSAAGYVGFGVQAFLGTPTGIEDFTWGTIPQVTPEFTSDQDAGTFAALTERGEQSGAAGWADSDGSKYQWALVGKKRERIRFRLTVAGACASFVLRSLELLLRPSGKQ